MIKQLNITKKNEKFIEGQRQLIAIVEIMEIVITAAAIDYFFDTKSKAAWYNKLKDWETFNMNTKTYVYTFYGEDGFSILSKNIIVSANSLKQDLDEHGFITLELLKEEGLPVANFTYKLSG